jgi:hypothetical protein
MTSGPALAAAVAASLALAACGSSQRPRPKVTPVTATTLSAGHGRKTFSAPGMALHFTFPAAFGLRIARSTRVAGNVSQASQAAVGINRFDLLIVSRFPHRPISVTARNIARLRPQFDFAVSQALGHRVASTVTTVAGLPALTYPPAPVAGLPVKVMSRIVDVFVGSDEYELNCQYTPEQSATITSACGEMLATLRVTG